MLLSYPTTPWCSIPAIAPAIASIVKVSGFDISDIRVSYSPYDDTLSIGIDQPQSGNHSGEVIAGDSDNNGNSGTVNPENDLATPGFSTFEDPPDWGGTQSMGAFIDFTGSGNAQIVAGFSPVPTNPTATDPTPPKPYEVAVAIPTGPNSTPAFGTELPQFEGDVYTQNSIAHPNLEFSIKDFSQLYKMETGTTLTPNSVIYIGGFGGSAQDTGIGEAYFPEQPVNIGAATAPNSCPPASPPIVINPHEHG